jgi:hypothetical protein
VHKKSLRCARGSREYFGALKVDKRSFLGALRVHYEGLRSMMPKSELF